MGCPCARKTVLRYFASPQSREPINRSSVLTNHGRPRTFPARFETARADGPTCKHSFVGGRPAFPLGRQSHRRYEEVTMASLTISSDDDAMMTLRRRCSIVQFADAATDHPRAAVSPRPSSQTQTRAAPRHLPLTRQGRASEHVDGMLVYEPRS